MFFFYRNHIYDAIEAMIHGRTSHHEEKHCDFDILSAPFVQVCADMEAYLDREYRTNSLPLEIETIVNNLTSHVLEDLNHQIQGLMNMHLGMHQHYRVERCKFLPNSNDMMMLIQCFDEHGL